MLALPVTLCETIEMEYSNKLAYIKTLIFKKEMKKCRSLEGQINEFLDMTERKFYDKMDEELEYLRDLN